MYCMEKENVLDQTQNKLLRTETIKSNFNKTSIFLQNNWRNKTHDVLDYRNRYS